MKKVFSKKLKNLVIWKFLCFSNIFLKILYEENFETPEGWTKDVFVYTTYFHNFSNFKWVFW